jgi:predicted nucleotide-binding protein (sugar kinase/HSP70/actin superfamily)
MAAVSKHYGDVNVWIEKIIDSCDSTKQQQTIYKLIQQFNKMLNKDNTLDYSFNESHYYPQISWFGGSIWNMDNRSALKENDTFIADVGTYSLNTTQVKGVEFNESGKYDDIKDQEF